MQKTAQKPIEANKTFAHTISSPVSSGVHFPKRSPAIADGGGTVVAIDKGYQKSSVRDRDMVAIQKAFTDRPGRVLYNVSISGDLEDLHFNRYYFSRSDFSDAIFHGIVGSRFESVAFESAEFRGSISGSSFNCCNFNKAKFTEDCGFRTASFVGCSFVGAEFVAPSYDSYPGFKRKEAKIYKASKLLGQATRVSSHGDPISGDPISSYDFYFFKGYRDGPDFVKAGCRVFTISEYRKHILTNHAYGKSQNRNARRKQLRTLETLRYFERLAKVERELTGKKQ